MAVTEHMDPAVTADAAVTVREVARLMRDHDAGAVVLVREGRPAGLLTHRDLALALAEEVDPDAPAGRVASSPVIAVDADADADHALRRMDRYEIGRLVVIREGAVAGMLGRARLAAASAGTDSGQPVASSI